MHEETTTPPPRTITGPCPRCGHEREELNGEHYRAMRRRHDGTLKEVARHAGCSIAHLWQMERGVRPFLPKYAEVYERLFDRRATAAPAGRSPRHGRE